MRTVLAALLLCLSSAAFASTPELINTLIDQTNFLVNRGCSGTLIDAGQGYILTANHCIADQYEDVEKSIVNDKGEVEKKKYRIVKPGTLTQIDYSGPNEVHRNVYVFKIVGTDNVYDLALLKVQTKLPGNPTAATIACRAPQRGDTVYAVGNSYAVLYSTVTTGIVSSVNRNYRDLDIAGELGDLTDLGEHGLVQHSAIIAGGNSGGALYNEYSQFVGVNVRGAASGFGFAVPLEDVKKFLTDQKADYLWKDCK